MWSVAAKNALPVPLLETKTQSCCSAGLFFLWAEAGRCVRKLATGKGGRGWDMDSAPRQKGGRWQQRWKHMDSKGRWIEKVTVRKGQRCAIKRKHEVVVEGRGGTGGK